MCGCGCGVDGNICDQWMRWKMRHTSTRRRDSVTNRYAQMIEGRGLYVSIPGFFGRFSATVTNSSWQKLELFRKFLEFTQKNGKFLPNSLKFSNFKL